DQSVQIAQNYPVKIINHNENKGLAVARNTAIQSTDADILTYIDIDAYSLPDMHERLLRHYADPMVCGVGGQGIEARQLTIEDKWRKYHASQSHGNKRIIGCEHLFGLCMSYRKTTLLEVGGFDTRFRTNAEDVDIGFRINAKGGLLVYEPEAVVNHQRQDGRESLLKAMYFWYYWGFIARKVNHKHPWRLALGTLKRLLWSDTIPDLFNKDRRPLVKLDVEISFRKINALVDASIFRLK
ncbi:MAG: glycosyltransferase, partial [Candidatus Helarchaeota archaeon]|nr:glycosyltransferase [Candidatus Helarchaeota archaeon]